MVSPGNSCVLFIDMKFTLAKCEELLKQKIEAFEGSVQQALLRYLWVPHSRLAHANASREIHWGLHNPNVTNNIVSTS